MNMPLPSGIPAGYESDGDGGIRPVKQVQGFDFTPQDNEVYDEFSGIVSYYGSTETFKYLLPDGKQYLIFKRMNEGDRVLYEKSTQQDVHFSKSSDAASIRLDTAATRHELLKIVIVDWHIAKQVNGKWSWVTFSKRGHNNSHGPGELEQWLLTADPKIVGDAYLGARKFNPFLSEDMTSQMIKEEIDKLEELLDEALKREAQGKNS